MTAVVLVYIQVGRFDFVSYDDPEYVSANPVVQGGLTLAAIKYAFTAVVVGHWAPVTMLSHIVASQLFGLDSGMHHLVSLLIHLGATVLLFAAFRRATGSRDASAFVAMIFALHPLHVESVAWIAERKDVLSAFFWFLALYAYVRYCEKPNIRNYLLVVTAFVVGLLSKSMLVTFPFTLLLLDYWPLRRARSLKVVWEKLPLVALSMVMAVVTWSVQTSQSSSEAPPALSLGQRIASGVVLDAAYIVRMFWPAKLSVMYPFPGSSPVWQLAAATTLLLAITVAAIYWSRTRPYVAVGWFWYLGTLVPVNGMFVQVIGHGSDRYTYIPMVGLTVILAWGAADVLKKQPRLRPYVAGAFAISALACVALSSVQTGYWMNSETLFQHAVEVNPDNAIAEYNLASCLMRAGRPSEAIEHFRHALRVKPNYAEAHNNLGIQLASLVGHDGEALEQFETAVRLRPDLAGAQFNLGVALSHVAGRLPEAISHLETSERLQPNPRTEVLLQRLRSAQ
ncbi:MAG TPA: tetratricopeptide repeat protein [Bryobacteraceae bacterium]|jgi:hypothetical protein